MTIQASFIQYFQTNYALWHACKGDFEKYKCESKGDKSADGEAAHLLLCLQEQVAEGTLTAFSDDNVHKNLSKYRFFEEFLRIFLEV